MNGQALKSISFKRDLGVSITNNCLPGNQCALAAKKNQPSTWPNQQIILSENKGCDATNLQGFCKTTSRVCSNCMVTLAQKGHRCPGKNPTPSDTTYE